MQTAAVKRLPISSWSMEDRPSDKMIELGTSALTDAELLSIVIGSGTHKASAVDIAKHLLADHQNNLHELGKAEFNEICGLSSTRFARRRVSAQVSPAASWQPSS